MLVVATPPLPHARASRAPPLAWSLAILMTKKTLEPAHGGLLRRIPGLLRRIPGQEGYLL